MAKRIQIKQGSTKRISVDEVARTLGAEVTGKRSTRIDPSDAPKLWNEMQQLKSRKK